MTSEFLRYELHTMVCSSLADGCLELATYRLQAHHRTLGPGYPAFYCKKHGEEKYKQLQAELVRTSGVRKEPEA